MLRIGTSFCCLTLTIKCVYHIVLCSHAFVLAKIFLKIMLHIGTSFCCLTLTKKVSTTSAYFLHLQVRHIPSLLLRQALYWLAGTMGSCLNPWCGILSAGTRIMYSEPNLVDGHLWNPGDMSRLSMPYRVGEVEGRGVVPDSDISTSLCSSWGAFRF